MEPAGETKMANDHSIADHWGQGDVDALIISGLEKVSR